MADVQQSPFTSKITHSQDWVGSPAQVISGNDLEGRRDMIISNNAGQTLYIGSAGVTMNNGFPIAVGEDINLPIGVSLFLYGVGSGAGSTDVRVIEVL